MVRQTFVATMVDAGIADVQIADPSAGPWTTVRDRACNNRDRRPNYILACIT